ncbi:MAG: ferritin family protein [Nitrospirota bacterium]|jgi:rubrerythrin
MWTLTEVFKMALYNEVRSQLFYQKAAEITEQDESREWLRSLAAMEENHARQIAERIANGGETVGFDPIEYLDKLTTDIHPSFFPEADQVLRHGDAAAVFAFAKEMELTARNTYEVLAEGTEVPAQHDLFASLAAQEQAHHDELCRIEESLAVRR